MSTIVTHQSVFYKLIAPLYCSKLFVKSTFLSATFYPVTCTSCDQGVYYQTGDVTKVIDDPDSNIVVAQIQPTSEIHAGQMRTGFVQDQYCEKSSVLTWLIPTLSSPQDRFDPSTFSNAEMLFCSLLMCWTSNIAYANS